MTKTVEEPKLTYQLHECLDGVTNIMEALKYAHTSNMGVAKQTAAYGIRKLLESLPSLMEKVGDYEDVHTDRDRLVKLLKDWADSV